MTKEEKQLLLKDLCARLPYGVKILDIPANVVGNLFLVSTTDTVEYETNDGVGSQTLYNIKPYLRPMSSMTEEEKKEFEEISNCYLRTIVLKRDRKGKVVEQKVHFDNERLSSGAFGDNGDYRYFNQENFIKTVNWLLFHHFDFRGLIPMGLALKAQEDMYKTE